MSTSDDIERQTVVTSIENKGDSQQDQSSASEHDKEDLLPVVDDIPFAVWLIALVGTAERCVWYGATSPLPENYIQHSPLSNIPGVLGLREATATNTVNARMAGGYFATIPAAVVADTWLGRYRTILISPIIELCGSVILFVTSFPRAVQAGATEGGLATAIVLIAYTETAPKIKLLKNGRKVITDRGLTIQYIYNVYYWMVNVGGLSALITTVLENCTVASVATYICGSVLPQASRAMVYGIREGFQMDGAKPQKQHEKHQRQVPWTDTFISLAGQMVNSGVPNDTIKSLNPISSILLTPVTSRGLYPCLTQRRIRFGPMARILVGFLFPTLSMVYTAILQKLVYSTGPCYDHPLACPESDHGRIPNQISMSLQTPTYILGANAEIFCFATGTEYAYNQAPETMKSVVQSVWMATAGVAACLVVAFTPITKDPYLVILYSSLAGVMAVATVLFGVFFGKLDRAKAVLL
ncbi:peptide transporter PTR2 [Aspergillus udagawae]|nr:peptide transporter PTR2 [Aspergillus udagawae]